VAVLVLMAWLCACACALVPSLTAARWGFENLRRGATPAPRERLLRRALVISEIALAFVLVACVTLLGRSFLRLLEVNPGFDARGVLALQVSLPSATYDLERVGSFYSTLHNALQQRLGAGSISFVDELPLTGDGGRVRVGLVPGDAGSEAVVREAGPGYFDVMRMPVVTGRGFDMGDDASATPRVVLSEGLARRLFSSERPIGRRISIAGATQMAEVIGIAGDVKHGALDEALLPTLYLSALQARSRSNILVVRAGRSDTDVVAVVRAEVGKLDSNLPVYRVRSMDDIVAASPGMPVRRVVTATFTGFAVLALFLGAVGLFGVVTHEVASRRPELAIRMALGADPTRILRATLEQGGVMVASGVIAGGVLSIWAARALSAAGFAPSRFDSLSLVVPSALLIIAGLAAVLPAARRAARTDPLIALRSE
jgi:predicted permease